MNREAKGLALALLVLALIAAASSFVVVLIPSS
jgi:hypothetical protein